MRGERSEMMNAPDRWAPKSAKHDEHDAAVVRARHWHAALHLAFLLLGAAAGYVAFQLADRELPLAFLESLYDDEYRGWEVLLCGLYLAVLGWLGGEAGNAAWILLCRYHLGLSAEQMRAALDGRVLLSFVLIQRFRR